MDSKIYKILNYLKNEGVAKYKNISPLLITFYPDINPLNGQLVRNAWAHIYRLLDDMKSDGFIKTTHQYPSIGSGNDSGGYLWLDTANIDVAITQKGLDVLEQESKKGLEERMTQSLIETNESIRDVNKATIANIEFQKKAQKWSIGLASASVLFIAITIFLSVLDKTPQRLEDIKNEIQSNTKKSLDTFRIYLERINSSIHNLNPDTALVKKVK